MFGSTVYSQTQSVKSESLTVDGKIDISEWSGAKVFTEFYKFIPKSEDKNYDSTTVYIKQTKDAIYFGFDYFPKGKVISKSLTRDRSTEDENEFFILLDLENKNQNGYFFSFSFLNNQRDAIIYNQRNQSNEWDWIWEVKSVILSEAKDGKPGHIQTEVKIPVDKLQNKNKKQIGVDVQMFAYKEDGNYYYYSLIPNSELLSIKNTYKLNLTTPFEEKLNMNLNVIPFAVGQSFNNEKDTLLIGGDINVSLDKHRLKGTINPDVSTLEADPFRFSLYARPIFLQEKRPFFSKDLDIYRTPINLFYTRAIEEIKYGFNYTYRSDNIKVGSIYVEDRDEEGNERNFFIARPDVITKNLNIGSLFIHNQNKGLDFTENVASFDGFYRFPENPLRFQFQVANSWNQKGRSFIQGSAIQLYTFYQSNEAGGPYADLSYNRVNRGFLAITSFNNQTGLPDNYDELSASGGYKFIFDRKYFSDINLNAGYYRGRILETNDFFPANFNLQNNIFFNTNYKVAEWLRFNQYFEFNRPNDFNQNGELITRENMAQEYSASFFFGTNFLNLGYYFGPYFGSFIKNPYINGNIFLFDKLALSASLTYVDIDNIKRTIVNTRLDFKPFNRVFLRSYFQRDNLTKQALWNSILQYEFFAGSNIYLVLNMNGDRLQYVGKYFKVGYEFIF
jgi:hypothetical protein